MLARGDTARALRAGPLRLRDGDQDRSVQLDVVDDVADAAPVQLALVSVKSHDTAGVAAVLSRALADDAVVLSLQNGVGNPAVLGRALPAGVELGAAAVYLGCQRLAPDHVVRRPSIDRATGRLRDRLVGGGPARAAAALEAVGEACGVPVELVERPETALWTKLVANASLNTVTALGRARVGRVFADPRAVELMLDLGAEVEAVAAAAGVPLPAGASRAYVAGARRRLPADGGSSTLFDLEAGRRLERDALVGAVVREGRRLGVAVPVSEACDALLSLLDPGPGLRSRADASPA